MRYEFENLETGQTEVIDTEQIDYEAIWDALELNLDERVAANKIINCFILQKEKGFIL